MSRLGIYADKIEERRRALGLTPSGFREDGTDAAGADKEAMLRKLYERADAHLPPGIGGIVSADADESTEDVDDTEA